MEHHTLDVYPIPKEKQPMFINEPWLIDDTIAAKRRKQHCTPEPESDNIRVYLPLDLNQKAILRRLRALIARYGEANEANEFAFSCDVAQLVAQIEIYDQIWFVRHMPKDGRHSQEAKQLVREFVSLLGTISDGGAETFPFELIRQLRETYLE